MKSLHILFSLALLFGFTQQVSAQYSRNSRVIVDRGDRSNRAAQQRCIEDLEYCAEENEVLRKDVRSLERELADQDEYIRQLKAELRATESALQQCENAHAYKPRRPLAPYCQVCNKRGCTIKHDKHKGNGKGHYKGRGRGHH